MKPTLTAFVLLCAAGVCSPAVGGTPHAAPTPAPSAAKPAPTAAEGVAAPALPAEKAEPVRLRRFEQPPSIDGRLDEAAWKEAAVLKDFYQTHPGDNAAPSKPTEVRVGFDSKFLYVAFRAFDEPDKVRATVAKRDAVEEDDHVRLALDTFNDRRRAYLLFFNPHGVQQDGVYTEDRGADFSVDLVLESKGAVDAEGYVVEVAIPFKSLRYEAGRDRLWGLHVQRKIKRFSDELDSWMPIRRDLAGWLNQAGRVTGLEGISTERTLELIPSLTVSETGRRTRTLPRALVEADPALADPGRMVNAPVGLEAGLTAKLGLTPTVTLDFAYNPDFAQVEADAAVVTANQRFPIFFEEKRPFFLEGKEIFETMLSVVNTRAIVDPDYAAKLSGKRGRNTFGLLVASDAAPGNFSEEERTDPDLSDDVERFSNRNSTVGALRLKRDVGREHSLGLFATTSNFVDRHNHLAGLDGRFRLSPQTTLSFQVAGTHSRRFFYDPGLDAEVYRTGNGLGYSAFAWREGRNTYVSVGSFGRSHFYRADLGFTRRTGHNSTETFVRHRTTPRPNSAFTFWGLTSFDRVQYDWRGRLQGWNAGARNYFNFARQTWVGFGFDHYYERLYEDEFGPRRAPGRRGAFAGAPTRGAHNKVFYFGGASVPHRMISAEVNVFLNYGAFDLDLGAGERFPRVSPAALADPDASDDDEPPLDPGPGRSLYLEANLAFQPTESLRLTLDYTKNSLRRDDTRLVAFDANVYSARAAYQFTRFTFARARLDYNTLDGSARGQFLVGWTPNPGTAFFAGYNDDLNRNGFNPFTGHFEPGLRRNGRQFFLKLSYLLRRSFGG